MKQWVRVSLSIAVGLGVVALGAIANSTGAVEGHSGAPARVADWDRVLPQCRSDCRLNRR